MSLAWKLYKLRAWLTKSKYQECPTCGNSGPPLDGGRIDWYTGPDESECTSCAVARHYGWIK